MFKFLLIILINGEAPQPVAAFVNPSMCLYMAAVINKSDINGKAVTYTIVTGDTTTLAVTGLKSLLTDKDAPPEFQEIDWTSATNVLTATAAVAGVPFAGMAGGLIFSATGGTSFTQATTIANLSPSDVNDANNWLRGGVTGLPASQDDVVLRDSNVPLLWNLDALSGISFNSFTRWNSFTGEVGLPENNPLGYIEFRPTYFQMDGYGNTLAVLLGVDDGAGPKNERYNFGGQQVAVTGRGTRSNKLRLLATHVGNTLNISGMDVELAVQINESSGLNTATIRNGGKLTLGPDVLLYGTVLTLTGGAEAMLHVAPLNVTMKDRCRLWVLGSDLTFPTLTADEDCVINWLSNSNITTLTLSKRCTLDKSWDIRTMTITNATMDGDCQVLDPMSRITWTNAVTVKGVVSAGPITFLGDRTVRIV